MLDIRAEEFGEVEERLRTLSSLVLRKKIYRKVGTFIKRQSKKRIAQQKDLSGTPFKKRSKNTPKEKKRKKMLRGLARQIQVFKISNRGVEIGFKSPRLQKLASKHQYGHVQKVEAKRFGEKFATGDPATRDQAKALIDLGFKIRRKNGKGSKKPSIKWIENNLDQEQAGYVIRKLRIWHGEKIKEFWEIAIPARSFIGVNAEDKRQIIEMINTEIDKAVDS